MEKLVGSNSIETSLSRVNFRMEIKLVTREGEIKTLLRRRGEDVVGMDGLRYGKPAAEHHYQQ